MNAAQEGNLELVKQLIAEKADVNSVSTVRTAAARCRTPAAGRTQGCAWRRRMEATRR